VGKRARKDYLQQASEERISSIIVMRLGVSTEDDESGIVVMSVW